MHCMLAFLVQVAQQRGLAGAVAAHQAVPAAAGQQCRAAVGALRWQHKSAVAQLLVAAGRAQRRGIGNIPSRLSSPHKEPHQPCPHGRPGPRRRPRTCGPRPACTTRFQSAPRRRWRWRSSPGGCPSPRGRLGRGSRAGKGRAELVWAGRRRGRRRVWVMCHLASGAGGAAEVRRRGLRCGGGALTQRCLGCRHAQRSGNVRMSVKGSCRAHPCAAPPPPSLRPAPAEPPPGGTTVGGAAAVAGQPMDMASPVCERTCGVVPLHAPGCWPALPTVGRIPPTK